MRSARPGSTSSGRSNCTCMHALPWICNAAHHLVWAQFDRPHLRTAFGMYARLDSVSGISDLLKPATQSNMTRQEAK